MTVRSIFYALVGSAWCWSVQILTIFLVCKQSLGMWRTMSATHVGWIRHTYSFVLHVQHGCHDVKYKLSIDDFNSFRVFLGIQGVDTCITLCFFLFRQSTCVPVLTHLPPSFLHLPPCESPSNKCYQPIGRNWNRMSTVALTSPRYFSTSNKNMKICPWLEQALPKYFTSNSKKLIVWSHSMLIAAQIQN